MNHAHEAKQFRKRVDAVKSRYWALLERPKLTREEHTELAVLRRSLDTQIVLHNFHATKAGLRHVER